MGACRFVPPQCGVSLSICCSYCNAGDVPHACPDMCDSSVTEPSAFVHRRLPTLRGLPCAYQKLGAACHQIPLALTLPREGIAGHGR